MPPKRRGRGAMSSVDQKGSKKTTAENVSAESVETGVMPTRVLRSRTIILNRGPSPRRGTPAEGESQSASDAAETVAAKKTDIEELKAKITALEVDNHNLRKDFEDLKAIIERGKRNNRQSPKPLTSSTSTQNRPTAAELPNVSAIQSTGSVTAYVSDEDNVPSGGNNEVEVDDSSEVPTQADGISFSEAVTSTHLQVPYAALFGLSESPGPGIAMGEDDDAGSAPQQTSSHQVQEPVAGPSNIGGSGPEVTAAKAPSKSKEKYIRVNYDHIDFRLNTEFNLKICSWNVACLNSWTKKGCVKYIDREKPDIVCLQGLKCTEGQIPDMARIPDYHHYWLCKPDGKAGVAIFSRREPLDVKYGIGDAEQDETASIITAEYPAFYLVAVFVPSAGRQLVALPKRLRWDGIFHSHLTKLNDKKPVIIAGDMNVVHRDIDMANPKPNSRYPGCTQKERDGLTKLLSLGFVDSFRHLYPDKRDMYTYWSYMGSARERNIGWRLDYFIVSDKIITKVVDSVIRSQILGSDHCPIILLLNL